MLKIANAAFLAISLSISAPASAACDTSAVEDSAPCSVECLCATFEDYECIIVPPGYDDAGQMEWWPYVCPAGYDVAACVSLGGSWWVADPVYPGVNYPACVAVP